MMPTHNFPINLRPFPYPYKAGLAICSDIDCCDSATFLKIHRILNTDAWGLNLPVADSFFGVGKFPGQMAYFKKDGKTPSEDADFIRHAISDGLIDSLHTWGDFNEAPPDPLFLKKIAVNLTEELKKYNLKIQIWINHGDKCNRQNFDARLFPNSYLGSDPNSPWYTANMIRELGIKYYWWSEFTDLILSERTPRFVSLKINLATNEIKNTIKHILGKSYLKKHSNQITELAVPFVLKDEQKLFAFTRFWKPKESRRSATRCSLRYVLSAPVLRQLIQRQGYIIVYIHLGIPAIGTDNELFFEKDMKALKTLAEYYHNGDIWVTTTKNLLNYWMVRNNLIWESNKQGRKIIIKIKKFDDFSTGLRLPEISELAGICFYTDRPNDTIIYMDETRLPCVKYPEDHTQRASVGFRPALDPSTALL